MITVLTVYRSGEAWPAEYVTRLRDGVAANLSLPHRFVCLSDTAIEGVECLPLAHGWPGWWAKVEMFRPDLPFDRVLYIDLSTVVTGSLDEIASQDSVVITADWYYGTPSQSVLLYSVGDFAATWEAFLVDPEGWMARGDQRQAPDFGDQVLMNHTAVPALRYWQDVLPGQVASFKVHGAPKSARLVKFHGHPKPHDVNWLEPVEFSATLNTAEETMRAQVRENVHRALPWQRQGEPNGRRMIIVGGGPSLADALPVLRAMDGDIFALNGAHDYLIGQGIVPRAMVLLDARQANVAFVRQPRRGIRYYVAAVCHPDVFDALEGHDVVLWCNIGDGFDALVPPQARMIGGGATVGMKAPCLGYDLGYRAFAFFGMDSSFRDEAGHAYAQAMNGKDAPQDVWAAGRRFLAAPWMIKQTREFQQLGKALVDLGCEITVHGDGLLPHVARHMNHPAA